MKQEYCYDDFKYKDKSIHVHCDYFAPSRKQGYKMDAPETAYDYKAVEPEKEPEEYREETKEVYEQSKYVVPERESKWSACGKKIPCNKGCCQEESYISKDVFAKVRALYSSCTFKACQTVRLHDLVICPGCCEYEAPFCVKRAAMGDCDKYYISDFRVIPNSCPTKCKEKEKVDVMFTLHAPVQLDVVDACGRCFTVTGVVHIALCMNMHIPCNMCPEDFEIRPCLTCGTGTMPAINEAYVTAQFEICANTFHERLVCVQTCNEKMACPSVPIIYQ